MKARNENGLSQKDLGVKINEKPNIIAGHLFRIILCRV
jgi:ribosome-binding protein aMBF1 (putative translation factor)